MAFRTVRIPWRAKALMFHALGHLPTGVYYRLQRHVTRTVPRRLSPTAATAACFIEHAAAMHDEWGSLAGRTIFEFGAGWDLYGNLVLWCLGLDHQVVYDLMPLARPAEIDTVIGHLIADPPPGAVRVPHARLGTGADWAAALLAAYGIAYTAPADAAATPFPDGTFDAIVTTSVFEHLPPPAIDALLIETRRILKPGGLMLHAIDYTDHYAHSDAGIGRYNFLRFTAAQWRRYSPPIHYQNRLRHADYLAAFARHALACHTVRCVVPADGPRALAAVPLAPDYRAHGPAELTPAYGFFVLRRADTVAP